MTNPNIFSFQVCPTDVDESIIENVHKKGDIWYFLAATQYTREFHQYVDSGRQISVCTTRARPLILNSKIRLSIVRVEIGGHKVHLNYFQQYIQYTGINICL